MRQVISDPVIRAIRVALAERDLPRGHLAAVLGLTHAAVSRRLRGDVPFRVDELARISEDLGIPMSRFFSETDVA